ncbi:MAG: ArsR family transcriptional regulator [Candidatus Nitrosocaldaceae archaeon]
MRRKHKIDRREIVLHIIEHFPAIKYKELIRLSKSSHGSLSYHISMLEKEGLIIVERGKSTRLYSINVNNNDRIILRSVRNNTRKSIINTLIDGEKSLEEINSVIKKSRSTLLWHINYLIKEELVIKKKVNRHNYYLLNNRGMIISTLRRYHIR